jgi:ATP-dependent RNA helicase DDX56/DBP9
MSIEEVSNDDESLQETTVFASSSSPLETVEESQSFTDLGLDARLTRVLAKLDFAKPTLIQAQGIPIALSGRDLLAKAPTGSGKTLAYILPVLHKILLQTQPLSLDEGKLAIQAIIFVPTRELALQVSSVIEGISCYCSKDLLRVCNLSANDSISMQRSALLASSANLIVSTPSRLVPHLSSGLLVLQSGHFHTLVLDEADLLLSFGFQSDLDTIVPFLPKLFQTMLFSATLSDDLDALKALLLRAPAIIKVEDAAPINEGESSGACSGRVLKQYTIGAEGDDKYLLTYVTLKLNLLKGKILIFCNSTDRAYRLKLFLDQFGVKSGVLNPELPLTSRHAIVDQFNRSAFDVLIAADLNATAEKEGGVARGVDFKRVDVVFNFDFPTSLSSYTHRVGRTARGVEGKGTAVSLVDGQFDEPSAVAEVRAAVKLTDFPFPLEQVNSFRYRCTDALRAATKSAIKRARALELERQILASKRLSTGYFADRPKDLQLLRNDTAMSKAVQIQPHMKHLPDYLLQSVGIRVRKQSSAYADAPVIESPEQAASMLDAERVAKRRKQSYLYGGATTGTVEGEESSTAPAPAHFKRSQIQKVFSESQSITAPDHLKLPQIPIKREKFSYLAGHSGSFEDRQLGYRAQKRFKKNDPLKSRKLFK